MFCGMACCHQVHCCIDEEKRLQGECNVRTTEFVLTCIGALTKQNTARRCVGVIGLYYCVKLGNAILETEALKENWI